MYSPQIYSVPIVFQELRPSEVYFQIFDSLENLNKTVEDVFDRISVRVTSEKTRIQAINSRLSVAQAKVKQITGTNKAITVFSPAKYPAPARLTDYIPLYFSYQSPTPKRSNYKLLEEPHLLTDRNNIIIDGDILVTETAIKDNDFSKEGLGRLPDNLPSISSLLLFNTPENPYKKYVSLDNLAGTEKIHKKEEEKKEKLAEAPKTFTDGDILPAVSNIEYVYKPTLGEVPTLHLPSVLPNLPNVADISWSVNPSDLLSIAPSFLPSELPSVDPNTSSNKPEQGNQSQVASPPPPPLPSIPNPPLPSSSVSNQPNSVPYPPSPPVTTSVPSSKDIPSIPADRANLLEDIKKGHIGRLKKKDRDANKKEKEKPIKPNAGGGSGDIFVDLIQALNRRRVGIAEKQKETPGSTDDNDIIAPPETTDEDWK